MSLELLLSIVLVALFHLQCGDGRMELSIKDFTSDANNTNADYSQAFKDAWNAICEAKEKDEATTLVIHANETYIIQPQVFQGPCASGNLHIQIDGRIEAPKKVEEWGSKEYKCWLCFTNVRGLVLNGSGVLDAHGQAWWHSVDHSRRPRTVDFNRSSNIIYNGLTQMNSPKNHISISNCTNATLSNLLLIAPEDSPNTDGIDIALSNNIHIFNSSIQTGDDCVAINGGSYDINITHVACGPGHGISIGSLGRGGIHETVENVTVSNCSFNGTQNGARIKTWTGGKGFARNIIYENITLINAKYPIIIDQHYCNGGHTCTSEGTSAVEISNVTFKNFKGTCAHSIAIKLDCDEIVRCHHIRMEDIDITSSLLGKPITSYCQFADIVTHFVSVDISSCHEEPEPPTPSPQPLFPALPPRIPVPSPSPYSQPPRIPVPAPSPYSQPPSPVPAPSPYSQPPSLAPAPSPCSQPPAPAESPTPFPQPLKPPAESPRSYPKPPRPPAPNAQPLAFSLLPYLI